MLLKLRGFNAGEFPTRILNTRKFGDLVLAETYYAAGQQIETHAHNHSGFIVILDGEFQEHQDRKIHVCRAPEVIFRPAGHLHSDHFEKAPARCLNIQYGSQWLNKLQATIENALSMDPEYYSGGKLFQLGLRLYTEFQLPDLYSPLVVEGLLLEMIGTANRLRADKSESGVPLWLKKTRARLHSHFAEAFSIQELAREAGVHSVYLNRAFRKHYGQSIGEYVRSIRMQFCAIQLSSTNLTIADISSTAGFYDQGHFSRHFKRTYGISPLAYRRMFRKF